MNVLIIGAYGLRDGYLAGSNALKRIGCSVGFFPLFDYRNVNGDLDDIIRAINGEVTEKHYVNMDVKGKAKVCIWWHMCSNLAPEEILKIRKNTQDVTHIQISWDASYAFKDKPMWKSHRDSAMSDIILYDHIFTCNPKMINFLRQFRDNVEFLSQGYDLEISKYVEEPDYSCDVSIVCTNLYTDGLWDEQRVNRKQLLDEIYKDKSIKLYIYGPKGLKQLYPESYRGFIPYNRCHKVFSNSKININISPVGDSLNDTVDGVQRHYFSERLPQILACKGLMLADTDYTGILTPGKDYCLGFTLSDCMVKIYAILKHNEDFDEMRESGYAKSVNFTWEKSMEGILSIIDPTYTNAYKCYAVRRCYALVECRASGGIEGCCGEGQIRPDVNEQNEDL